MFHRSRLALIGPYNRAAACMHGQVNEERTKTNTETEKKHHREKTEDVGDILGENKMEVNRQTTTKQQ